MPERQGNLMALGDEWWCPYLSESDPELKFEERFPGYSHQQVPEAHNARKQRLNNTKKATQKPKQVYALIDDAHGFNRPPRIARGVYVCGECSCRGSNGGWTQAAAASLKI